MQDLLAVTYSGDCVNNKDRLQVIELRLDTIDGRLDAALGKVKKRRSWKSSIVLGATVLPVVFGIIGFLWHYVGLEVDKQIDSKQSAALAPVKDDLAGMHKEIQQISGDVRELKGIISVLQAPSIASKFSKLPSDELKSHQNELQEIKLSLAAAPKDTPNLWPAGFQVITLLSQAMFQLETIGRQPLSTYSNVSIRGFGRGGLIRNANVSLKNTIEGFTFENSVIHFDETTKLIDVQFTHCVFVFPSVATPTKSLQNIGATLLAADLDRVKITAG